MKNCRQIHTSLSKHPVLNICKIGQQRSPPGLVGASERTGVRGKQEDGWEWREEI